MIGSELVRGERVISWGGRFVRYRVRTLRVSLCLGLTLLLLTVAALMLGDFLVTPSALINTLTGHPPDRLTEFFVLGRRLPRALLAIVVGASLAISGAIFQAVTRNSLASPDLLGVSSGASVGAVVVLLVFGCSLAQVGVGAALGAVSCAALIMLLAGRSAVRGVRLILVGVAIAAMSSAIVDYVLSQVFVASATTAQTWLVGSLQGRSWGDLVPAAIGLAVVMPLLVVLSNDLRALELGDDVATALGVRTAAVKLGLIAAATALVAVSVAAAGPISFVALVSPHIASRISRSKSLLPVGLVGALVLLVSDLVALYALPAPIPVGAVTIVVGGLGLLWMLWREGKRRA